LFKQTINYLIQINLIIFHRELKNRPHSGDVLDYLSVFELDLDIFQSTNLSFNLVNEDLKVKNWLRPPLYLELQLTHYRLHIANYRHLIRVQLFLSSDHLG